MNNVEPIGTSGLDALIGRRVHTAMWDAHVTQTDLARALGVDQGSISRRLRGRIAWKVADIHTAARLCGVTVEDLLGPRDEQQRARKSVGSWTVSDLLLAADLLGVPPEELMRRHDVLGPTGAVTRGNRAAESRCTPARANRTPLVLIPGGGVAA